MAATPRYKIYYCDEYVAACKSLIAAAALCSFYGSGSQIRLGHARIVWAEGGEAVNASESYDTVAETVRERIR